LYVFFRFPLVLPESDMNEEMSTEIQELVVGLLEKHPFGLAAKGILPKLVSTS